MRAFVQGLAAAGTHFLAAVAMSVVVLQPIAASAQPATRSSGQAVQQDGWGMTALSATCNVYAGGVIETVIDGVLVDEGVSSRRVVKDYFDTSKVDWQLLAGTANPETVRAHFISNWEIIFSDTYTPSGAPVFSQTLDVFSLASSSPAAGSIRNALGDLDFACLEYVANSSLGLRGAPKWEALREGASAEEGVASVEQGAIVAGEGAMMGSLSKWRDTLKRLLENRWIRRLLKWFDILTVIAACLDAFSPPDAAAIASCLAQILMFLLTKNPWGALIALLIDLLLMLLDALGIDAFCATCRSIVPADKLQTWCPSCVIPTAGVPTAGEAAIVAPAFDQQN